MSVVGGILRRAVPFQTVERLDLVCGNVERDTDSSFCEIALLGFAIRINALVNIDEGKNQRD